MAYHGCERRTAETLLRGRESIKKSNRDFDWLGPGAYFWEADPQRAKEWADEQVRRERYKTSAVVGAVIDLGNCLDLSVRKNVGIFKQAHVDFLAHQKKAGLAIPKNENAPGDPHEDRLLRRLDCAVFHHLHGTIAEAIDLGTSIESFDTVRGMFTEGGRLYDGCGFFERTHVQIAVCNIDSIIGLFRPLRM